MLSSYFTLRLAAGAAFWTIVCSHLAAEVTAAGTYPLVKDYSGTSFFDGWQY
jgi:hypothetical protein